MTNQQLLSAAVRELQEAGLSETPSLDARVLYCHALRRPLSWLFTHFIDNQPSVEIVDQFRSHLQRRANGEPIAYIVEHKEFFGREFVVQKGVLIPRPDTEVLVETGLEKMDALAQFWRSERDALMIHEPCCGTGCVAISLQLERPLHHFSASDICPTAVTVSKQNASVLKSAVRVHQMDLLRCETAIPQLEPPSRGFDIIVANPPYLTDAEMAERANWHEPKLALVAGNDGLDVVRRLLVEALEYLNPAGYLLCEAGPDQVDSIGRLAVECGWVREETRFDLGNRPRVHVLRPTAAS